MIQKLKCFLGFHRFIVTRGFDYVYTIKCFYCGKVHGKIHIPENTFTTEIK